MTFDEFENLLHPDFLPDEIEDIAEFFKSLDSAKMTRVLRDSLRKQSQEYYPIVIRTAHEIILGTSDQDLIREMRMMTFYQDKFLRLDLLLDTLREIYEAFLVELEAEGDMESLKDIYSTHIPYLTKTINESRQIK